MEILQTTKEPGEEFYNYALDLEKEWRNSFPRFTDKELLSIFPEAKQVIPEKIEELEQKKAEFSRTIKKKLALIKYKVADEFSQFFWKEWIKVNEGQELLKIEGHIARLKRLLFVASGRIPKKGITDEMIQMALTVPIETIISQPLRKSGRALVGLCPFHQEKTPSFFIYPESHSFYCYGCGQGGNSINFVRLLYGYSFKEAVQYLIGKK